MIRTMWRFITVVSVLLFVATLILWARGRRTMDHFWLTHGDGGSEMVRSASGRLTVRHSRPNGRSRITFPRRVSHWGCRVGSQLPPTPSPLHWEWQFVEYEGTTAATAFEVRSAHAALRDAARVRAELAVTDAEWEQVRRSASLATNGRLSERQIQIMQAKIAAERGRALLAGTSYWEWTFPTWLAAVVTAAPPALWLARARRRRHVRRAGRCSHCGYDLRASPRRCPECGLERAARTADQSSAASGGGTSPGLELTRRYTA